MVWDMCVSAYWGGTLNFGTGWYQGVYRPSPEHARKIYWNLSYHGLVSDGWVESGNSTIKAVVGSVCTGYPRDKSGACSSRGEGEYGDGGIRVRGISRVG